MKQFGIIGNPLHHSFSAKYFTEKFAREGTEACYRLYPLERIDDFSRLCEEVEFVGMNVTFPYKESIIPYLTELNDTAQEIGAVNVIHFTQGKRIGYNTDAIGFMNAIRPLLSAGHKQALILGTGGAAKAVRYGLQRLGLQTMFVSRHAEKGMDYDSLTEYIVREHSVIVNCTPLGMYPDTAACPDIPYSAIGKKHLLYDVIYNPEQTVFLQKGAAQGATVCNGLGMLYGQAEAAWEIWK